MIDKNGFSRPSYEELVQELGDKWRELFGENAQINTHSVGGILIRVHAYFLDKLHQLAEVVYNSQFVDSAIGTTLDQLAANAGITRKPAQTAIGNVKIYGVAGYEVPAGTLFKTSDELMYVTTEDIILKDTGKQTLSLNNVGNLAHGTDNIGIGTSRYLYAYDLGAKYNKDGIFVARQVTPVENILHVEISDMIGGAEVEADEDLRSRITLANEATASSPYNGVLASIRKVNGVRSVRIVRNDTMEDDGATNTPAKSIHIFVDGGYKDDIAEAIFNSVAAGVTTAGEQVVSLKDISGQRHEVKFDHPVRRGIFIEIKLTKNEDLYPQDGDEQVKQAVQAYINSVGMGSTIYYSYLYQRIYNVSGVTVADVKIGLSKDDVSAQDIELSDLETAEVADNGVILK